MYQEDRHRSMQGFLIFQQDMLHVDQSKQITVRRTRSLDEDMKEEYIWK